jgi:hypothetical protein
VNELREWWAGDFEFQPTGLLNEHNRVMPVCFVATEIYSGRQIRVKQDELLSLPTWPINVGEDAVFVCYSAGAEGSCAAVLGWPMPHKVLDLYAERVLRLNREGKHWRGSLSLLATLRHYKLPAMGAAKKEVMRHDILTRPASTFTPEEWEEKLDYCAEDGLALKLLLIAMEREQPIALAQAFWRGGWTFASGMIEQAAVPVDTAIYPVLHARRLMLRRLLIGRQDKWGIHENGVRRRKNIVTQLRRWGVPIAAAKARGVKLGGLRANQRKIDPAVARAALQAAADEFATLVGPVIAELREAGQSLRQIAAELTHRGIQTARGGAWTAATVQRVLLRQAS